MKKIIILILVICPSLLYAQEINYTDGNCVSGDCQNGKGVYKFNNGETYSGNFSDGKFNGTGTYTYKSGAVYEGSYVNHQKSGKGVYTYSQSSNKLKYVGDFSQGKYHGYGTLTYKDGSTDEGIWQNDVGAKIGTYQNQDVLKKGDTIITHHNKYLLSKQTVMDDAGIGYPLNEHLPKGAFIIETDIRGQKAAIGYITTEGEVPSLSLYGATERYAKSSKGHKFYEIGHKEKEPFKGRTTKDYAAMAWMAYNDCPLNLNDFSYLEIININSGSKYYTNASTGYAGIAFLDKRDSTIIIANRGTEFTSWNDLTTDYFLAVYKTVTSQGVDANNFYDLIRKKIPNKIIEHTGHSLGGYLAQMLASINGEKAVVFESPGAEEVTVKLPKPKTKSANITNYSNSTVISNVGEQMGNTVYYKIPGVSDLNFKKRHSIVTFYNEIIDKNTGEPKANCLGQSPSTAFTADKTIDIAADATKTGLSVASGIVEASAALAGTEVTGFFATTVLGVELSAATALVAVPVLTVAAVNLTAGWTKCCYHIFKGDNIPSYCNSTTGIISNAWNMQALKEMGQGVAVGSAGKIMGSVAKTAAGGDKIVGTITESFVNTAADLGSIVGTIAERNEKK